MTAEKTIVIGCDDPRSLPIILNSIKKTIYFPHNIISAGKISDIITITKSLNPDLVILCFRDNQLSLNDFIFFVQRNQIPILCLVRTDDNKALRWNKDNIVFIYPLEQVINYEYFNSSIQSVFLLRPNSTGENQDNRSYEKKPDFNDSTNQRNLSRYVLELDQKVEVLSKIKDRISSLYPHVDDPIRMELTSIANAIKASANDSKLWDDFKLYFEQTNPDFLLILAKKHPDLTPKDLKYCCYLKMNMTNDDIRNLLGINQESVRTHKYRLKKKMSLPKNQDLIGYLRHVG